MDGGGGVGSDNDSKINVGLLFLRMFQWPQDVQTVQVRLGTLGTSSEGNYFTAG